MRISGNVDLKNNSDEVRKSLEDQIAKALETVGLIVESRAKQDCPVGSPESTGIPGYIGGTLRNSITHVVEKDAVIIGSNVEYAQHVEFDDYASHKVGKAHFLGDAVSQHLDEYREIVKRELKD